ncbi:MAG: DHHA1 domain-containing protein, partial [Pseudomonadota bacterium]|nr:DHHA1 domain-containing protein [Pseudomonadota bacterium]
IDINYRKKIMANHSATHLLHEALRRVLGNHVTQKGSKVSAEKLRFDFSHQKALENKEIVKVESTINQMIEGNSKVEVQILPYDNALKEGALALFGEKYTDEVRVLSMGDDYFSKELCGGTHVEHLGEIVEFKITSQNSVASGVRRIEAITGQIAKSNLSLLEKVSDKLKIEENKKGSKSKNTNISKDVLNGEVIEFGKIKLFFDIVKNLDAKDLRHLTDECKKDLGTGVSCIISDNNEKSSIAIGVTNDITDEFDAVKLIRMSAKIMDGKGGGGRNDMALAGATNIDKSEEVLDALKEEISKKS